MKRILIIEDERLTLHILQKVFEESGYAVDIAQDGEDGLNLFRKHSADLVITDIVMPVKDGLKTILELREIDESVPVIAISGGGAIAKERYLTVAEFLDNVRTVAKPFSKKQLLDIVEELLL